MAAAMRIGRRYGKGSKQEIWRGVKASSIYIRAGEINREWRKGIFKTQD
jgi:hypothetical protein